MYLLHGDIVIASSFAVHHLTGSCTLSATSVIVPARKCTARTRTKLPLEGFIDFTVDIHMNINIHRHPCTNTLAPCTPSEIYPTLQYLSMLMYPSF